MFFLPASVGGKLMVCVLEDPYIYEDKLNKLLEI
jgi:hypothetical protein